MFTVVLLLSIYSASDELMCSLSSFLGWCAAVRPYHRIYRCWVLTYTRTAKNHFNLLAEPSAVHCVRFGSLCAYEQDIILKKYIS